jgi:MFS transporter, NRE family, putaive nickel resistance protein
LGNKLPTHNFFSSGLVGFALLFFVYLTLNPLKLIKSKDGLWHEHPHSDEDEHHMHEHSLSMNNSHNHLHFHSIVTK